MRESSPKKAEGFSLLEVLVALTIISLTLFLTFQINSGTIETEQTVRTRLQALFEGETLLQSVLQRFPEKGEKKGKGESEAFPYTYVLKVKETPHPDALEVGLTISWREGKDTRTLNLTGIASK